MLPCAKFESLGRVWRAIALALALMSLLASHVCCVAAASDKVEVPLTTGSNPLLGEVASDEGPSLIDWKTYTAAFNKSYSSWRQALVRQNLFTVKKLQVFMTATKYRLNLLNYYMVINQYSDMTPEEERRKMSGEYDAADDDDDKDSSLDEGEDGPMDDEAVRKLLMAELDDPSYDQKRPDASRLAEAKRRRQQQQQARKKQLHKRSIDEQETVKTSDQDEVQQPVREDISLDDLIRIPSTSSDIKDNDFGNAFNVKWVVPSNNPDYRPMEQMSMGVVAPSPDDTEKVEDVPEEDIEKIEKSASSWLASFSSHLPNLGVVNFLSGSAKSTYSWLRSKSFNWRHNQNVLSEGTDKSNTRLTKVTSGDSSASKQRAPLAAAAKNDLVIKDWRETGCISPPIQQGHCMSCYAVTAVNHLEWSFCMHQERVLTPLSIQYLLSCGPQMRQESDPKMNLQLHGCDHGRSWQAMYFIKEYGAELAAHMPYLARDTPCPVDPGTPRRGKGYLRPNVKQQVRMYANTKQLDLALKVGPVIVNFHQPHDFFAYGGGMVGRCHPHGSHAMLIVGHGIENDKPYLIIKNSFGANWGMRGYFKFDRKYTNECVKDFIVPRFSFPSKKSQARHMKAYLAERQEPNNKGQASSLSQDNSVSILDKIFDTDDGLL